MRGQDCEQEQTHHERVELPTEEPGEAEALAQLRADEDETERDKRGAGDAEDPDVREARRGNVNRDPPEGAEREHTALREPGVREEARQAGAWVMSERTAEEHTDHGGQ